MPENYGPPMTGELVKAMVLAEELHRGHLRKGTTIPYLSHLLAVCSLVLEDGGGPVAGSAALLHDAAEDRGGQAALDRIRQKCGEAVADVVRECSDSLEDDGALKAPWRERKEEAIRAVAGHTPDALLVIAADKLHNARATLADLQSIGADVWKRFNAGPDDTLWYYEQMTSALEAKIPHSRSVQQLRTTVEALKVLRASQAASA